LQGTDIGKKTFVGPFDRENDGNGTEDRYLQAMHGDGVTCEGVEDANYQEQLEKYAEPERTNCAMTDWRKRINGR
jgi:hypothetical protein